jgi:LacI family transcriptional regulator
MRDVAALAGVSIKTVSRVVNAEPHVSPQVEARVKDAARKLRYNADIIAASLRRSSRRSQTLGLLMTSVDNGFGEDIHRAVMSVAADRHVLVFAASTEEDPDRERALLQSFAQRRVDGVIASPAGQTSLAAFARLQETTPLVLVDRAPAGITADAVLSANRAGAAEAIRHLLAGGHERIAILTDSPSIHTAAERLEGYREAILASGRTVDPSLVRTNVGSESAAAAAVIELLEGSAPPTALFAARNSVSAGAFRALRGLGLQHRIALVGFDDLPWADLVEPGLTVVAQNPAELGRMAALKLFARIDGVQDGAATTIISTRLIPRGSGEIHPPHEEIRP